MGNQLGFRSSEWSQPDSNKSLPINDSITTQIDSACILMDTADEKTHHIKRTLCWKSDTFMDYIRSITRLVTNHNNVTTNAIATSMSS